MSIFHGGADTLEDTMERSGTVVWCCYCRHGTGICLVGNEENFLWTNPFGTTLLVIKIIFGDWNIVFPWLCILTDQCIHNCDNATICLNIVESLPSLNRLVFSYLIRLLQVRFIWKCQPGFNYLKVNNGDTRALYEIYSEITVKTPDDLSLLLIIKRFHILFDFGQEIAGWESI